MLVGVRVTVDVNVGVAVNVEVGVILGVEVEVGVLDGVNVSVGVRLSLSMIGSSSRSTAQFTRLVSIQPKSLPVGSSPVTTNLISIQLASWLRETGITKAPAGN